MYLSYLQSDRRANVFMSHAVELRMKYLKMKQKKAAKRIDPFRSVSFSAAIPFQQYTNLNMHTNDVQFV